MAHAHEHGLCWAHPGAGVCYINIPRCASHVLKRALGCCGFHETNVTALDLREYWIWTVLRDPFERFVSGFCEYQIRNRKQPGGTLSVAQVVDRLYERFDEHFERQSWFVEGIKIDYFARQELLSCDIAIVEERLNTRLPLGFDNVTDLAAKKPVRKIAWELRSAIHSFYAADYELLRKIT